MKSPGQTHIAAAKHIPRYLKGTMDIGIVYSKRPNEEANKLFGYVDANHATDKDDRKSVGGHVLMLNRAAISWASRKLRTVALSSFESEYYSASVCGCEVTVVRRLLEEIGFPQQEPTKLHEDNMACIYALQCNRGVHGRAKHIDVRVRRLRQLVNDKEMELIKIDTSEQVADNFTKPLTITGAKTCLEQPILRVQRLRAQGSWQSRMREHLWSDVPSKQPHSQTTVRVVANMSLF